MTGAPDFHSERLSEWTDELRRERWEQGGQGPHPGSLTTVILAATFCAWPPTT